MGKWTLMAGAGCSAIATALVPGLLTTGARAAGPANGVVHWIGKGSQVYACIHDGDRFAWTLQRPDATLIDDTGTPRGQHGAGPSWTAWDGSQVFGAVLTSVPAPKPGAIPWLVLRASRHVGSGMMSGVGYVLRTDTEGGTAPAAGCDAAHVGAEERRPYRATYTFLVEPALMEPALPEPGGAAH